MKNMKHILFIIIALSMMLSSCSKESIHGDGFSHAMGKGKGEESRIESVEKRNVLVLYSAGYNSLSDYLTADILDLQQGWLPGTGISTGTPAGRIFL